mmetsp:Transcript_21866/g.32185  ORF Transcript_21866/g.32185 Transcript_21866/m.32185 type:complete len:144 (-) Transcript_21866:94-525(-)
MYQCCHKSYRHTLVHDSYLRIIFEMQIKHICFLSYFLVAQASRENKWFIDAASEAGLDVDENLLDGGLMDGDRRDRQRLVEANQAKAKLRDLLSKPMRRQNYGKFLSGVGLTESIRVESEVNPYVVNNSAPKRKKNTKKRKQT